jgi:hypothetical protein
LGRGLRRAQSSRTSPAANNPSNALPTLAAHYESRSASLYVDRSDCAGWSLCSFCHALKKGNDEAICVLFFDNGE